MTFIYAGNRAHVLQFMLASGLQVETIFAVEGSHLQKWLVQNDRAYHALPQKKQLADVLNGLHFDHFVSCGCPVIIPSELIQARPERTFVNIHPSLLPLLRGVDPLPGSILFDQPAGATCHLMDAGIGTGPAIAQVAMDTDSDTDINVLYRLSFWAEVECFRQAWQRDFVPDAALIRQQQARTGTYYTFHPDDAVLRPEDGLAQAYRRIRAFSNQKKGVTIRFDDGTELRAFGGAIFTHAAAHSFYAALPTNSVADVWDDSIILKLDGGFLRIRTPSPPPRIGAVLR